MATQNIHIQITSSGAQVVIRDINIISRTARAAIDPLRQLRQMLQSIATVMGVSVVMDWADQWTEAVNKVNVFTSSARETDAIINKLYKSAQNVRQPLGEMVTLYHRLSIASRELGVSTNENLKFTENVGKALAIQGTKSSQARGALLQLSQAMGEGIVRAQEFNSMIENLPFVLLTVAKNIPGVNGSIAKLRKMMLDGKLASDVFYKAFMKGQAEIDAMFAKTSKTFSQGFTVIADGMKKWLGEMNAATGASNAFFEGMRWLADNLDTIGKLLLVVGAGVATAFAPAAIYLFTGAVLGATKALLAMINAHPVAMIASMVAAAVLFGDSWDAGIDGITTVNDLLRGVLMTLTGFDTFKGALYGLWDSLTTGAAEAYGFITGATKESIAAWKGSYDDFFAGTGQGFYGVLNAAAKVFDAIGGLVTGVVIFIVRAFVDVPDAIGNVFKKVYNEIVEWMEKAVNAVINGLNTIRSTVGASLLDTVKMDRANIKDTTFKNMGASWAQAIDDGFESQGGFLQAKIEEIRKNAQIAGHYRRLNTPDGQDPVDLSGYKVPEPKDTTDKKGAAKALRDQLAAEVKMYQDRDRAILDARKAFDSAMKVEEQLGLATRREVLQQGIAADEEVYKIRKDLFTKEKALYTGKNQEAKKREIDNKAAEALRELTRQRMEYAQNMALLENEELVRSQQLQNARQAELAAEVSGMQAKNVQDAFDISLITQKAAAQHTLTLAYLDSAIAREKERIAAAQMMSQSDSDRQTIDLMISKLNELTAARNLVGKRFGANVTKELDDMLDPARAESFGEALKNSFGEAGNALAQLGNALQEYSRKQAQAAERAAKVAAMEDGPEKIKNQIKLTKLNAKEQIGAYADIAGAMKGFFKEGTKGYKALQAVEQAFRAFEIAMALEAMATKLFATKTVSVADTVAKQKEVATSKATVAPVIADETAKTGAKATGALAAALNTLWPVSIVAFGIVAGLLASIGAGGGGSAGGGGYTGIAKGGTGTVMGMEGEQSESISKSIELLADNSRIELVFSQRMLSELTKTREGIQSLAGTASQDFFIRGFAGQAFGDSFLDSGIGFLPGQTVADIIAEGVKGYGFNLIFDKGAQAMWSTLSEEFTTGVGAMLGHVAEVVYTAADALGLNDESLRDRMLSLIPTLGDTSTYQMNGMFGMQGGGLISLKDMSGKEIQEELEAIFSSVGDQMAAAALPALKPFQQLGEGMFETLIRLSSGIEQADYAMEKLGYTAIDYTDIVRKQGDVATEIIRQTLMNVEQEMAMYAWQGAGVTVSGSNRMTGVAEILERFVGESSELEELYLQLMAVRDAMKSVGVNALELTTQMIRGAGGLDELQSGFESYFENFFSEEEKLEAMTARLREEFQRIGVAMPASVTAFRDLVDATGTATPEAQYLTGQLMAVADMFYEVADASGTAAKTLGQLMQAFNDRAGDFLTPGQMQANAVGRIQKKLADAGFAVTPEQILGFSRADFANAVQEMYGRGDTAMLALMDSITEDFLSVTKSTIDALQDQQAEASKTVAALQADVDKWTDMRKKAQDLSKSISMSISGGNNAGELWSLVDGSGDMEERLQAAQELKTLIERTAQTELQAIRNQLQVAEQMLAVGKQLKAYVDSLKLGNLSALSPSEQMGEALRQYNDTLRKAQAGDQDAQKNLQSAADAYLSLAQQYDPGSYAQIFETVVSQLDAFGSSLISQYEQEVARQERLVAAAEAANGLTSAQIAQLEKLKAAVDKMTAEASAKQSVANAELTIAKDKLTAIEGLLKLANDVWTYLPAQQNSASLAMQDTLQKTLVAIQALPREFAANIGALLGYNVSDIPGFATGGNHTGGLRWVGENGMAELEATGPSRIWTQDQIGSAMANSNGDVEAAIHELQEDVAELTNTLRDVGVMIARANSAAAEGIANRIVSAVKETSRSNKIGGLQTAK